MKLTPNPGNLPAAVVTPVFSPRSSTTMLEWYAQRITDGATSVMFTGAFGVDPAILGGLARHGRSMRFHPSGKAPTADVQSTAAANRDEVLVSYGAVLGKTYERKTSPGRAKKLVPIPKFELDKWFLKEELARQDGAGFVFFIHTKFLLVDPLSNDPLVCTGSANFSKGSLNSNDENMLLIRGDTRVGDIYVTEFDRIFRHFYFRDIADELAVNKGKRSESIFLDETGRWMDAYFDPMNFKSHRRLMFFQNPAVNWANTAASDPEVFASAKKATRKATGKAQTSSTARPRKR